MQELLLLPVNSFGVQGKNVPLAIWDEVPFLANLKALKIRTCLVAPVQI